jgi:phospholipase C
VKGSLYVTVLPAETPTPAHASPNTATPIEHVIIIVGENRSFDHLYATYTPKAKGNTVMNLLSQGIVRADGSPRAEFHPGTAIPDRVASQRRKILHQNRHGLEAALPNAARARCGGVGKVSPYAGILSTPAGDRGLPPQDQFLFAPGGTGLAFTLGPDTRITNVNDLPPGPFQMTGPTMPFDAFTPDTIHQYFPDVPPDGLRHRRRARHARQLDRLPTTSNRRSRRRTPPRLPRGL